jgi:cAMP-dependent protein kinase regulator
LRLEVKKYRDLDEHKDEKEKKKESQKEEANESYCTDEDEDEVEDTPYEPNIAAITRLSRPRNEVSAEVYGQFYKKENFVPKIISKNEEQVNRIKARILQSFLFNNLDASDIKIVINAMDEKHYK